MDVFDTGINSEEALKPFYGVWVDLGVVGRRKNSSDVRPHTCLPPAGVYCN